MSQQISCLHNAVPTCGPEQKALIQSMLNIFIQPDYQRTCSRIPPMNMTHHVTPAVPSVPGGPTMIPTMMPTSPINSQLLLVCTQKIKQCQSNFNKTFTGNMAAFNISGLYNGMTAHQCVEQFQDCYVPFNMTFFPALHTANLSLLCT
ncbi:uncharacterized protein LOC106013762 [Aplysia californica]|uniref:Uncharacterized protein LOC106013762 n=1 Tax=Aplysia californica TaxID=6500 RepID=A0ABM1ADV7_APLCA|nr:uncharacterized protein LOC106013762 [Aplysia californica]